ncbi:hypothetical protein PsorP6_004705 [Peronosclerospora sorghi]|uniref:Uncharacterized protein n=1 Tax=Peronosclerospora sorghi TaxID=230839 RepID=A0ACC0VM31_9STRA|nr:hypothetical protein PsorP6_004705 [Peronosclerospora sorghi]
MEAENEEREVATASAALFGGNECETHFDDERTEGLELSPSFAMPLLTRGYEDKIEPCSVHEVFEVEKQPQENHSLHDERTRLSIEAGIDSTGLGVEQEPDASQTEENWQGDEANNAALRPTSRLPNLEAHRSLNAGSFVITRRGEKEDRKGYQCRFENCPKFAQAGGFCIAHGGGYRCQTPFCAFFNLRTCPDHGGSKRCGMTGCTRVALGTSALCCAHGGGRKCSFKKCDKYDAGQGLCLAHGGGRDCKMSGCTKKAIRYGLCSGHGGRARCKVEGCEKYDRGQGKCKAHGGGYFCKVQGFVLDVAVRTAENHDVLWLVASVSGKRVVFVRLMVVQNLAAFQNVHVKQIAEATAFVMAVGGAVKPKAASKQIAVEAIAKPMAAAKNVQLQAATTGLSVALMASASNW